MVWETFQRPLFILILVVAAITAVLGIGLADLLSKKKYQNLSTGSVRSVFTCLAIGYTLFALAELSWFLIFDVFQQLPSVSMPDFYWVTGAIFLLIGYCLFSAYLHREHGSWSKALFLLLFAVIVLGAVLTYVLSLNLGGSDNETAGVFLSYFYPITSALILIASTSIYLFFEKISSFKQSFLWLLIANIAFLVGDLLYNYYTAKGGYGLVGAISDGSYVLAYLLCSFSFLYLMMKIRQQAAGAKDG